MTALRRRRKRLHLTRRDVKVLEALVARRVETLDGLHAVTFHRVSTKRALNQLGELVLAGYLDRRSVESPGSANRRSVSFLTARGRAALQLRSDYANEGFATRSWRLDLTEPSIPHQIVTNRVIDSLGGHAIPERLLPPATEAWLSRKSCEARVSGERVRVSTGADGGGRPGRRQQAVGRLGLTSVCDVARRRPGMLGVTS